MPEPSFIAPLVPRTAADERWHLRAELRDAATEAFATALPCLIIAIVILAAESPWYGIIIPLGVTLGWRRARRWTGRPLTGASSPALRTPPTERRLGPYERRLIALIDAHKGDRAFVAIVAVAVVLALGDLLRSSRGRPTVTPQVHIRADLEIAIIAVALGVLLLLVSALAGYWQLLGWRYLAARAAVDTDAISAMIRSTTEQEGR